MTNDYNPGSQFRLKSPYGKRIDPLTGIPGKFHSGQDFGAEAGTPVPAAASGTVVYSGVNQELGNVVIVKNDAGGYSLYGHMQDGPRSQPGQRIWRGDTVGQVGSTGSRTTGNHLHYSVITDEAGEIFKNKLPRSGGPIGTPLNEKSTINPAGYDKYDPTPRYLDESKRVAQIMSGSNTPLGGVPSDRSGSLDDRFGKWGYVPTDIAPLAPSDRPESFDNRFGNWGSVPAEAGSDSPFPSPVRRLVGRIVDNPRTDGFDHGAAVASSHSIAFLPSDRTNSFGDRFGNWVSTGVGDALQQSRPSTLPYSEMFQQYLNQLTPSSSNANAPTPYQSVPPMFAPPDYSSATGNGSIEKWIASLAGVDPDDPTQVRVPMFSSLYQR